VSTPNLFLATSTLQQLLSLNIQALLRRESPSPPNPAPVINVTAMPPDRIRNEQNTINIYLYHALEDPHFRNMPPLGVGFPPVKQQPLVLLLYYILTAHHESNDQYDAETQQHLFGLALKTMHDNPRIDDSLFISPGIGPAQQVMVPGFAGSDNRLDIALRPLTPEESLSFWHADDSVTTRLSAYYEVRSLFLDPEPPTGADGLVLDLGLFAGVGMGPRLDRSSGLFAFRPPAATGLPPQAVTVSPARATLATAALEGPVNGVTLLGRSLVGDNGPASAHVFLRSAAWANLSPAVHRARIDPALNPAWALAVSFGEASFAMQGTLDIDDGSGGVRTLETTPGIYSAEVEVVRTRVGPGGLTRTAVQKSNATAFPLGARIDQADPTNPQGRIRIRLVDLFDLQSLSLDLLFAVDGEVYREVAAFAGDPTDAGAFQRQVGAIEFHPLFDPTVAGVHPVRLTINGAESQPFWVTTP
jgi:hypothetical protein